MQNFTVRNESERQPRKKHGCLWTVVICVLLYIGMCAWMGYLMGGMFSTPTTKLTAKSVYRLQLKGTLVEQVQESNPLAGLLSASPYYNQTETVGLDDLLSNIRLAKTDDRIEGIYLDGGSLSMAPASAKAIRDALLDFKTSGKWIIAYASSYGQTNYYVASVADKIFLNPTASIDWNGLTAQKAYYKRLFDKLGIEMQILKVGTFKSAVEPYFRTSMSEADRLQTEQYINGIWSEMKTAVAESRHIAVEQLDQYADEYMGLQPQEKYLDYGFADSLVYAEGMDNILRTYMGTKDYTLLSTGQLASVERTRSKAYAKVAVVYAEGEITDETGDGIVGKDMVKMFKKIAKDEDICAVVLRVNSPGGSADASEQIWHAVQTLKQDGRPVVVSMGDYAASGGYYISCGADYIFAEPTTLTGSIGIFGTVPNLSQVLDKVGLDYDGVSTNRHSDLQVNMVYKGMNTEEYAMMQAMVERGYDLFTRRCAEGRHTTQDAIKQIGEGRVWLGKDAMGIGLVDSLGNIDDAIRKAVELADIPDYQVVYYPETTDPLEDLLSMFDNTTDEEKLLLRVREFASKPRIMALMPEVEIH
ncbi:MAG: signal peptide peptidase SppA [Paludibacteraceae bacterium]|nr:signal peptide peptidase SppA [Paludibacteraceae bacterium]